MSVSGARRDVLHPTWKREQCWHCSGYGLVSVYSHNDFDGAGDCPRCDGTGTVWLSPSGTRYALYPGGPFVGRTSTSA